MTLRISRVFPGGILGAILVYILGEIHGGISDEIFEKIVLTSGERLENISARIPIEFFLDESMNESLEKFLNEYQDKLPEEFLAEYLERFLKNPWRYLWGNSSKNFT